MSISEEELVLGTFAQREQNNFDRETIQNMSESEREAFRAQRKAGNDSGAGPEIIGEKIIVITEETEFAKESVGSSGDFSQAEEAQKSEIIEGLTVNVEVVEENLEAKRVIIKVQ